MNMKKLLPFLLLSLFALNSFSQTKAERSVGQALLEVHKAVFVNKDSVELDRLFAPEITYGHSGGKLETRQETIHNVGNNKSTYTGITATQIWILVTKKTAVTRYLLSGTETRANGEAIPLHLNIIQTWVKRHGKWKMLARQAVKVS